VNALRISVRDVVNLSHLICYLEVFVRHFAVRRPTSATAHLAARQPLYFGCDVGPINCQASSRATGSLTGSAQPAAAACTPGQGTVQRPRLATPFVYSRDALKIFDLMLNDDDDDDVNKTASEGTINPA